MFITLHLTWGGQGDQQEDSEDKVEEPHGWSQAGISAKLERGVLERARREEVVYNEPASVGFYRAFPCRAEDAGETWEFIQVLLFVTGCAIVAWEPELLKCAQVFQQPPPSLSSGYPISDTISAWWLWWGHKWIGPVNSRVIRMGLIGQKDLMEICRYNDEGRTRSVSQGFGPFPTSGRDASGCNRAKLWPRCTDNSLLSRLITNMGLLPWKGPMFPSPLVKEITSAKSLW